MQTSSPQSAAASSNSDVEAAYPWLKTYPENVDWNQTFTPEPLYEILDRAAANGPSQVCTNFLGQTLTYSEIHALANRAASGLQAMGVTKGTKVGLLLPNCASFIILYFAVLKAGGTVVNYNPLYTVEELDFQVKDSETKIMVTLDLKVLFSKTEALLQSGTLDNAIVCSFPALLPGLKSFLFRTLKGRELVKPMQSAQAGKIKFFDDLVKNDGSYEPVAIDPLNDIAVLQYTGGTTGAPKGAMLTHANLSINVKQVAVWTPTLIDGEERVLGALPFFHVFAMTTVMNFAIIKRAEIILMPRFDLKGALKLISTKKPTVMPGVPTIFNAIMNFPAVSKYDLSSLKFCISGGAPLPVEVKRGFESVAGCNLVEGYGLSETSPVATYNPIDGPIKEGSIGVPAPQTIISIRSLEDPAQEMPQGEKGEICIRGPQVMKGYWKQPDETANVFIGDYLRTGDVGYMDEDGFTFIVDRLKDIIICSGYNVYPRRIEEAIYEFPAVEEVTVVGIADEYRGEAPKAFVKLKPGESATVEELLAFLKPKISVIEMPSQIEFRDELPKTMIGKLSKKELRQESEAESQS